MYELADGVTPPESTRISPFFPFFRSFLANVSFAQWSRLRKFLRNPAKYCANLKIKRSRIAIAQSAAFSICLLSPTQPFTYPLFLNFSLFSFPVFLPPFLSFLPPFFFLDQSPYWYSHKKMHKVQIGCRLCRRSDVPELHLLRPFAAFSRTKIKTASQNRQRFPLTSPQNHYFIPHVDCASRKPVCYRSSVPSLTVGST